MTKTSITALSTLFNSAQLPQRMVVRANDDENGFANPEMMYVMPITAAGEFTYDNRPGRQGLVLGFSFVSEIDVESLGNDTVQQVLHELREQYQVVGMSVFIPDVNEYGTPDLAHGALAASYVRDVLGFKVNDDVFQDKHMVVECDDDTWTNYMLLLERIEQET